MSSDITKRIKERIGEFNYNAFIIKDLLDIASYDTVSKALNRLASKGEITRIMPGMYYCPYYSKSLNMYSRPNPEFVAKALARKYNWHISDICLTALCMLRVITDVMPHWIFVITGKPTVARFGNVKIEFWRGKESDFIGINAKNMLVIQAIRTLKKGHVNDRAKKCISSMLTAAEKETLLKEARLTSSWVYEVISEICEIT
ncbi:MAG: DUF6088 family protein [Clostridiales bacterium]|jgi:predicted transcriptional regulator of viral defense system|nr:DUF6088 family protein [Clostridiales bacterium]